ncbi:helix-turn-helix domain-containing protein [Dactylosporangium sp. CA-152071]|uniref:helix-turn-helix domain-containing protein n=1 Tax=Dactylosporangium sp. CA-152071 TaxID=3239933 RepID=UPI003D9019E5
MISVSVGGPGLAYVRLTPSPVAETLEWLRLAACGERHREFGDPGAAARFALRDRDVALVGAVLRTYRHYVPDLLMPSPPEQDWDAAWRQQLEQVRATPAADAVRMLPGNLPREVRDAVQRGTFAGRAARALRHFYDTVLAEQISTVRAAIDAEVAMRARLMARHGIGHAVNTLHPKIHWSGAAIDLRVAFRETWDLSATGLPLVPSLLGRPGLNIQLGDPANSFVQYALRATPAPPVQVQGPVQLFGAHRAAILRDLDVPRSTTELSRRHRLSKSTVSYHLAALLGAGLLVRAREGKAVHYSRSRDGDQMMALPVTRN